MKFLQAMILAVVVLDAALVMTTATPTATSVDQATVSESSLGPSASLMASR